MAFSRLHINSKLSERLEIAIFSLKCKQKYESKKRSTGKLTCFLRIRTQTTPLSLKFYSFAQLVCCTQLTEPLLISAEWGWVNLGTDEKLMSFALKFWLDIRQAPLRKSFGRN